jgi:predicted  nucleic acid-binding Zn-ribbon protein
VLAAAIWFNWQAGEDVAAVAPDVELPVIEAEPEPEADAVADAVEEVSEPVAEAVEQIADEVEEAVAEGGDAVEAVEETVAEAVETVEETVQAVEEGVVEVVEETIQADPTTISIPGTDTSYTLINAFRRDNGAIEVTTEQLTGGTGATLWLVTCAPLAVGEIATGPSAGELSARIEDPEMTEIPLSDARAMIAATACGVMR